jgi:hypothetical protein
MIPNLRSEMLPTRTARPFAPPCLYDAQRAKGFLIPMQGIFRPPSDMTPASCFPLLAGAQGTQALGFERVFWLLRL